jgi:predicted transposase/invertase (TIGR01784 family)
LFFVPLPVYLLYIISDVEAEEHLINEAYCKLQAMSEDEANRMIYEARLKAQRDDYSRMQGARREGLQEGEAKATRNIIFEMDKNGMDVRTIAAITHVSEGEVNGILMERKV